MTRMRNKALREYAGKPLEVGTEFDAEEKFVEVLIASGLATLVTQEPEQRKMLTMPAKARRGGSRS